jgi:hypothetical protein
MTVAATTGIPRCPNLITDENNRGALAAIRFSPSELPGKL